MLNIAYTFNPQDEMALALVSKRLHQKSASEYVLGVNSVPHVSITHIEGDASEVDDIWQKLQQSPIPSEIQVVIKTFVIDAPWRDRVYSSFSLEGVGSLSKIQKDVMRLFDGRGVFNGYGADFEPHITTGCHLKLAEASKLPAQKPPFKKTTAYLTIGSRDSYGRMVQIYKGGYVKPKC